MKSKKNNTDRDPVAHHIHAFLLGMAEFKLSFTTSFDSPHLVVSYDRGREMAHRLTLRRFES